MTPFALITDHAFPHLEREREVLETAGFGFRAAQCQDAESVIREGQEAGALLVQWAPITAEVLRQLPNCKVIVRYGIGVDNVDLEAASAAGIAVCNVPEYCIDEVADHTLALALSLGRQLPQVDGRVRSGTWRIMPDRPMRAFREMTFVTLGFGRVARAVLARARAFGFKTAAYDPFVAAEVMEREGSRALSLDEAVASADVLSLHLPLTAETRHLLSADRIAGLKDGAIVINTARGGLIDTVALAGEADRLGGIGLDVFESEPLEADHPLRTARHTILTSHIAWYSENSVPLLQQLAAEEAVRGLRGQPLKYQLNRTASPVQ